MSKSLIGRQPIFDRDLNTYGFEILFRSSKNVNSANVVDGNYATSKVILNLFMEIGLVNIVGEKLAFLNLTREFVLGENALPFGPQQVVLEVLEDIAVDDELKNAVVELSKKGYKIALDDFVPGSDMEDLIEFVDVVKFDLPYIDRITLYKYVNRLKNYDVKLLAEKVETLDEFEFCKDLGFDYFQGYFFCKPKIISGSIIPENRLSTLRILSKLQNPDVSIAEIEELVSQNVALSYKILKYINSAAFSLNRRIDSIEEAITYMGLDTIKQWVTIMSIAGVENKPRAILDTALIRSKMCSLLSQKLGQRDFTPFSTTGLLSVIDVIMDKSMEDVVKELPLSDTINRALVEHSGLEGEILSAVTDYERGRIESLNDFGLDVDVIVNAYIEAVEWTEEIKKSLT